MRRREAGESRGQRLRPVPRRPSRGPTPEEHAALRPSIRGIAMTNHIRPWGVRSPRGLLSTAIACVLGAASAGYAPGVWAGVGLRHDAVALGIPSTPRVRRWPRRCGLWRQQFCHRDGVGRFWYIQLRGRLPRISNGLRQLGHQRCERRWQRKHRLLRERIRRRQHVASGTTQTHSVRTTSPPGNKPVRSDMQTPPMVPLGVHSVCLTPLVRTRAHSATTAPHSPSTAWPWVTSPKSPARVRSTPSPSAGAIPSRPEQKSGRQPATAPKLPSPSGGPRRSWTTRTTRSPSGTRCNGGCHGPGSPWPLDQARWAAELSAMRSRRPGLAAWRKCARKSQPGVGLRANAFGTRTLPGNWRAPPWDCSNAGRMRAIRQRVRQLCLDQRQHG